MTRLATLAHVAARPALFTLGYLTCVALFPFALLALAFLWVRAWHSDRIDEECAEEPEIEFTGCTDPDCGCIAARARILDRLAASGQVPGLTWGDDDDRELAELLGGECE